MGAIAANFAIFAIQAGDGPEHDYSKINRSVALSFSKVPGLGQLYLNDRKMTLLFLSVYPILAGIILAAFEYRSSDGLYLTLIILVFISFSVFASMINVEVICNKRGLPILNKSRESGIKNYHKGYVTLTVIATVIVIAFTMLCLVHTDDFYTEEKVIWLYILVPLIWIVGTMITYFITKNNVPRVNVHRRT
jgi:ABC-type branched-subunit amino acid transport system permease subunit